MTTTAAQSAASIKAKIKKVPGLFDKPKALVQEIGVDIVSHAKQHGDCTLALPLVQAVPAQMQRSLIMWFMAVSPIGVLLRDNGESKARFIKEDSKAYNKFDLDKAKATNWWEMDKAEVEREMRQLYAGEVFEDIIKRLDRIATGEDTKTTHYTDEARQAAAALKDNILQFRSSFKSPAKGDSTPKASGEERAKAAA